MTHEQPPSQQPDDPEQASTPEQRQPDLPTIWVGSLADYNNGDLHGDWLDAARSAEDIHADIQAMLARGPAAARGDLPEEWGIFDYEGFGELRIGEYESIEYVSQVARGIAEHGPAFAAWADVMEAEDLLDGFTDTYLGHYDSLEAYAESWLDDAGYDRVLDEILPESIRGYVHFDAAAFGRDLRLEGDIHAVAAAAGIYVFRAT